MESVHVHMNTSVVQDDDLEQFTLKLGEAVSAASFKGPPRIAFSHAPKGDGFNYAAVVVGYSDPNATTETRMVDGGGDPADQAA